MEGQGVNTNVEESREKQRDLCGDFGLTFGCELEWSDIDRRIDIPKHLGHWEGPKMSGYYMGSELDIVNTKDRYRGVAVDPLCLTCPVGGEIHTVPSRTIQSQFFRILRLMDLFPRVGVACPNHGHIHVHVPGLSKDLAVFKRFFKYVRQNEKDVIRYCGGYTEDEAIVVSKADLPTWATEYFLVGDAKHLNPDLDVLIDQAVSIEEALEYLATTPCMDYFWVEDKYQMTENSHRTAINLFNLTKSDTIEFRVFRASLNPLEIFSTLKFAEMFTTAALTDGPTVAEMLTKFHWSFPKLNFDEDLAAGWVGTRQTKGRCGPFKKSFYTTTVIEDPIVHTSMSDFTDEDKGLATIWQICNNDWHGTTLQDWWDKDLINAPTC